MKPFHSKSLDRSPMIPAQRLDLLDPIENYQGTPLEGLDAFQRQLKRFDIPFEKINRTGETEHDA